MNYLECQQEEKRFYTVKPSVHKVSQEEVVCLRDISPNLEEFFEVIVLSMNISTYLFFFFLGGGRKRIFTSWGMGLKKSNRNWRVYSLNVALFYENFPVFER